MRSEIADNNQAYKDFVKERLKIIYDANKQAKQQYGYRFNTEFVPAENLGVKNAKWDKEAGYQVPRAGWICRLDLQSGLVSYSGIQWQTLCTMDGANEPPGNKTAG